MTTTEVRAGIFGPLKTLPEGLYNAAAILGAERPPRAALSEAIETVWVAGLTHQSGARQKTILEAVGDLVFAVFDHSQSEIRPEEAAHMATGRLSSHMKFDRQVSTAKGGAEETPLLG